MAHRSCQMSTYMSGLSVRVLRFITTFPAKTKKNKVIKKHTSEINTIYMTLLAHDLIRQTSKLFSLLFFISLVNFETNSNIIQTF